MPAQLGRNHFAPETEAPEVKVAPSRIYFPMAGLASQLRRAQVAIWSSQQRKS
jgi:hypothetical protein